jgi:hypothetical protein
MESGKVRLDLLIPARRLLCHYALLHTCAYVLGKVTMDGVSQFLDKNSEALVEVRAVTQVVFECVHRIRYA